MTEQKPMSTHDQGDATLEKAAQVADEYSRATLGCSPMKAAEWIAADIRALKQKGLVAGADGCPVCGVGADGKPMGYVCPRNDCPTKAIA